MKEKTDNALLLRRKNSSDDKFSAVLINNEHCSELEINVP